MDPQIPLEKSLESLLLPKNSGMSGESKHLKKIRINSEIKQLHPRTFESFSTNVMGFCDWFVDVSFLLSDFIYASNVIFALITSLLSAIALGRIYSKNQNSNLTFGLFCASCGNLFVAIEVTAIAWVLVYWEDFLHSGLDTILIVLFFHLCQVQTSCLFLLIAIQRFLLWKKPITFMNQKKKTIAWIFIGCLAALHMLTFMYFIPHFMVYKDSVLDFDFDMYTYIEAFSLCVCILLTVASIGLQVYVSLNRGWSGDASREETADNQSPVYFSALAEEVDGSPADQQKISNVTMDEHNEIQEQAQREAVKTSTVAAVSRIMMVITTMTCLIGLLNIVDTFLWADVTFGNNYTCWHSFVWEFTTYGYFMKMWTLSVALFIGCPSLFSELNFIPALKKRFSASNPPVTDV